MIFDISRGYSDITGLRNCDVSEFSGEDFYHKKLNEVFAESLKRKEKLTLIMDGTLDGYSPSFVDEMIGNLVYDFSLNVVKDNLIVISQTDARWPIMLKNKTYPEWEKRRKNNQQPRITERHSPWYRLQNGSLVKDEWIEYQKK